MAGRKYPARLAQALKEGLVETLLYHKRGTSSYQEWFGKVLKQGYGLSFGELSTATALANRTHHAGQELLELDRNARLPLNQIPVNRYLFGDEPHGNRLRYHVRVRMLDSRSGRQTWRSVFVDSPINLTQSVVFELAEQSIPNLLPAYVVKGVDPKQADWHISGFEMVSVSRRY